MRFQIPPSLNWLTFQMVTPAQKEIAPFAKGLPAKARALTLETRFCQPQSCDFMEMLSVWTSFENFDLTSHAKPRLCIARIT